ncbi:MAG: ATP-binding protein [Pseudomonadota bacterium]|jgi:anti-sigma regulatory factor (Ser/Thr protein kinase)
MKNSDSSASTVIIRIPWALNALSGLLDQLDTWGRHQGWSAALKNKTMLVLEELVVNAITYGERQPESGFLEVRLCDEGTCLRIDVLDNGIAFDPFSLAAPDIDADLDSRPVGGLGIFLTKELSASFSYQRINEMNHVRLSMDAGD